ncbi:MAG: hypothetical protein KDK66_04325 [Deltaproteobacteria bacterium]|nr:hypothetical protein [Deltaproteobacteria bacterium]
MNAFKKIILLLICWVLLPLPLGAQEKNSDTKIEKQETLQEQNTQVEFKEDKSSKKSKKKKNKKHSQSSKETIARPNQVANVMAEAWCQKYEECADQGEISPDLCRETMRTSFKEGFKRPYQGNPVEVTESTLFQCEANIKKASCQDLNKMNALKGCEFIVYLNRE